MSRFKNAFKALINPTEQQHYERSFLTILSDLGFNKTDQKKLLNEGYLSNTYVYAIINRICETAADVPIYIEAKNSKGDVEIIEDGDFYNFVHNPNPETNYKTFIYQSLAYQLATGNTFQYGIKGVGSAHFSERWNLAPQYIEPKVAYRLTGAYATSYKYTIGGTIYPLSTDEVLHVKKFNPDPNSETPVFGLSPLQVAYRTLVASNEIITADASLIKNKGMIGMLSYKGDRPLTEQERSQTQEALKRRIGGADKYGSIGVSSGEFDMIKFAMSPQDLQILESGIVKLRDLCSVFGVSSRMFNDADGTTFSNLKEDNKKFYTQAILPPLEMEIDYFNRFFAKGWSERDGVQYTVRLDVEQIEALQTDYEAKIKVSKDKSEIVRNILSGVGVSWSRESAIEQLVFSLDIEEEAAIKLVDNKPIITTNE